MRAQDTPRGCRTSLRRQKAQEGQYISPLPMWEPTGVPETCQQLSLVLPAEGKILGR